MKRGDSSSAAKNSAACSGENQGGPTEGSLDCSGYRGDHLSGKDKKADRVAGSECPDNLSTGKFWMVTPNGRGTACKSFRSMAAFKGKTCVSPHKSGRLA